MISVREEILSLNARNRIDSLPKGRKSQFFRDAIEFYVEYLTSNSVMTKEVQEEIEKLKKEVAEIRCLCTGESRLEDSQEERCFEGIIRDEVSKDSVRTEEVQEKSVNNEEEELKSLVIKSIINFMNNGKSKESVNDEYCG